MCDDYNHTIKTRYPSNNNYTVTHTNTGNNRRQFQPDPLSPAIFNLDDSSVDCKSTVQYKECDNDLLRIVTLVLYGIFIPCSLVINPWVSGENSIDTFT